MADAFAYSRPLRGANVRLIKIVPDVGFSVLKIHLVEINLNGAVFEALSYVWGDQTEKRPIKCNGKRLDIGANLYDALLERRRRKITTLLWADQISINQKDTDEKTRQVRLMRDVYARAVQVTIWLGKQQPEDEAAYKLAEKLFSQCNGKQYDADIGKYDFHDFNCADVGVPKPAFNPRWTALFKIISNPWFGRVWVIQELLSAQKSVMWRGCLDMDTDVVLWSSMLVGRHRNLYIAFDITMGSRPFSGLMARNIAAGYYDFKKTGPLPVYDVLSRYLGMGATDPRDRYFSLVGVALDLDPAFVDYKKSFRDVACLVGKMTLLGIPTYWIAKDGTELLILREDPNKHRYLIEWLAFHANPKNNELGLPSWVPDLLSHHSAGLLMTGFYNSLNLQGERHVPNPRVRFGKQGPDMSASTQSHWQIQVPDVSKNASCLIISVC